MSYSWFRQGSCTVDASDVVRFQGANITTAPNKPVVGDAFTVGGFRFYEIIFIGSDATGEYIRLNRAYEEAAGSNISYAIARFASGTQNAKLVAMASAAINQKQISLDDMYEWYTSQADTVQFLGPDGTFTTLTTYFKLSQEITAVGGNSAAITVVANEIISVKNVSDNMADVKDAKNQADRAESEANRATAASALSFAMSQAQFDAIRGQNKERYAASGWVSFGNHESGKQVNECKSGLYTALTTPNTLLIGKTGGAGGSKTDYASVHIDGVVFNLTNQFVLTLPSHPTSVLPERMDMYGVEAEKVEISAASPNAYQGGLRGVGAAVNLFSATDQQKKDFFTQNSNTTFIGSDGKIYQWQVYKIAFAGTTGGVPSPTEQGYTLNSLGDLWLKAGKNLLYFGNVLRLNSGGYHPSFNPLGAAKFVGDTFWYNTATSITSKDDCFNPAKLLAGSGSIASGKSGRPEVGGRYYDAIYAAGHGGVCRDMRYSAHHTTLADISEADLKVKNGTYRGFEKLKFTRVVDSVALSSSSNTNGVFMTDTSKFSIGDVVSLVGGSSILVKKATVIAISTNASITLDTINGYYNRVNGTTYKVVHTALSAYTVGGKFLQTDISVNPAQVSSIDALKNGWGGSWVPVLPASGAIAVPANKKILASGVLIVSNDLGASWPTVVETSGYTAANDLTATYAVSEIRICQYTAFATQLDSSISSIIYGGAKAVGRVRATNLHTIDTGCLLAESCINKVLQSGTYKPNINDLNLKSLPLQASGILANSTDLNSITHEPLSLAAGQNNMVGFKVLDCPVNLNHQAFIQYTYTEFKYNGTNWGDDGKVTIVDNQSTKTDLNGNTVLVGTAKLKEPIGWIKNKV